MFRMAIVPDQRHFPRLSTPNHRISTGGFRLSVGVAGGSVVVCWRHRNGGGAEWAGLGLSSGIFWLVVLLATLAAFLTGPGAEYLAVLNSFGEW